MPYPVAVNLPFNFSAISNVFQLGHSPAAQPAEEGFWCIIQGNSMLLTTEHNDHGLPTGELPPWLTPKTAPLCIGLLAGKPLRAFSVSSSVTPQEPFVPESFNNINERMDMRTMTLGGMAKQILHWNRQSSFCSICGGTMAFNRNNWGKQCSSCNAEHFPHIHPCAIVLVRRENMLLMTRKVEWIAGRYSLVAGFVDFGESLEECAAREVREETGITIKNIRYAGSQNWPFPSQLMAGFIADYADGEIMVDHDELEDARWFPMNDLPVLPPARSIARWIIDNHACMC